MADCRMCVIFVEGVRVHERETQNVAQFGSQHITGRELRMYVCNVCVYENACSPRLLA